MTPESTSAVRAVTSYILRALCSVATFPAGLALLSKEASAHNADFEAFHFAAGRDA